MTIEGALTMLAILLPAWTGWTVAILVAVVWLWVWALCRAAALGDEMICCLLRDSAEPRATRGAGDAEAEPPLTPQRAAAATISLADVAETWKLRSTDESGGNVVEIELVATADTSGWTMIAPNRKPIPVRVVVVAGDSIVTEAGPYESAQARSGQDVHCQPA